MKLKDRFNWLRRSIRRKKEWWALGLFSVIFIITFAILLLSFYYQSTKLVPTRGGSYIEGAVGELKPLNPWFTMHNDVNSDIARLVFAGPLKYNPETKQIEEDLATIKEFRSARVYTIELKENIEWHDSTKENPHYVTADDVLFTYKTIQDPDFPNKLLQQNFEGVTIEKLSNRTVRFTLAESYSFFPSNLTLGLLPANAFKGIPVAKLDQTLGFGLQPIGAGPYAIMRDINQSELSTEVTLERFDRPIGSRYHLEQIIFRIFPDYSTLLSDLHNLDGIRLAPRNDQGEPQVPRQFTSVNYALPQYVALFFNMQKEVLQTQGLRLGLQLGINKQEIVDDISETIIVDTPLLEIDLSDWRYQFDPQAAKGAFFNSEWHLPEKLRLQRLLEIREANLQGPLKMNPVVLLSSGAYLTMTGSVLSSGSGATVNDIPLKIDEENPDTWSVALPTSGGTGSLIIGENLIRLYNKDHRTVDTFYLWWTDDDQQYRSLITEQQLVDTFLQSREGVLEQPERITVLDMYLDEGILRKRYSNDPIGLRQNEKGEELKLTLLTSSTPKIYKNIAKIIKNQLEPLGVGIEIIIPETRTDFEESLLGRNYDILLFGQSLLDNLDSYPYWHSSGIQNTTESVHNLRLDAYNLSQYKSLQADTLLEFIRVTTDPKERSQALKELRDMLKEDIPAVFLYSPLYTYSHHSRVKGIDVSNLSLHSDRFITLNRWYTKENRQFKEGKSWWSFFGWIFS